MEIEIPMKKIKSLNQLKVGHYYKFTFVKHSDYKYSIVMLKYLGTIKHINEKVKYIFKIFSEQWINEKDTPLTFIEEQVLKGVDVKELTEDEFKLELI